MQSFFNHCILALLCITASAAPGGASPRSAAVDPNGKTSAAGIKKHDNGMMRREGKGPPAGMPNMSPQAAANPELDAAFNRYDTDGSGVLETNEAQKLMLDLDVPKDSWKALDADKNGAISRIGFERLMADLRVFRASDADGSDFLESAEVENVVKRAGLTWHEFNWKDYDHNKDNKLSLVEFLEAGPAAATAAAMQAQSLIEEDADSQGEGEDEVDVDAILEEPEEDFDSMSLLEEGDEEDLKNAGDESYGDDHDGSIDMAAAGKNGISAQMQKMADQDDPTNMVVWHMYNTDGNKYLDKNEQDSLAEDAGFPKDFDLDKFDKNRDGNLDMKEFLNMAREGKQHASMAFVMKVRNKAFDQTFPEQAKKRHRGPHPTSLGQNGLGEDHMFQSADEDNSGFLEEKEIQKVIQEDGGQDINWKDYDEDGDGKLSQQEFVKASMGN